LNENPLLTLSTFFFSYAVFLLISYKTDPRYTLKYDRKTSFYRIAGYSTINRIIFITLLVLFSFSANQNLISIFGLENSLPVHFWLLLGILAGLLIFFLGMPINLLIQIFRIRLGLEKSRREEEILKIMFQKPVHPSEFIAFLSFTTVLSGLMEELIFRGFLTTSLMFLHPAIAILIQAFLFFVPSLYQGLPNALLVFYKGVMLGIFLVLSGSIFVAITARLTSDIIGLLIQAKSLRKILKNPRKS